MVVYEPSGLVEVAFSLGIIVGFFLIALCAWVLIEMRRVNFRRYYLEMDDDNKKDIMCTLENISTQYQYLAMKTNTVKMKSEYNTVLNLIAYLKKRMLP